MLHFTTWGGMQYVGHCNMMHIATQYNARGTGIVLQSGMVFDCNFGMMFDTIKQRAMIVFTRKSV